ncbi:MAG: glycosyltransferase [Verrucomicrobia bacterium]|nr:MAG: glycosyltransferase [Verrucomicrobiota bacterium]TAF25853.1 MAG: glycosyltransferase [Verrucomicrobiota bacterium]
MDFTIVTPSYNYGHYIGECLQSVADQEGVSFEHLIMDAGSKDDTAEVVVRFPHASFFQEPDKGMSDGINKGFRRANGKWVMWLNADDRLKPGALKAVKEFADRHSEADVIYGCWNFIDAQGNFIRRMTLFPFDRGILIQYGCYIGSTACFYRRRTTIDEGHLLDVDFGFCMDGEYYARLDSLGKRFAYCPKVLADFRLHGESISQQSMGKRDMKSVLRMQRQAAEPRTIRRIYGMAPFRSEHLNCILDAVLFYFFRLKKCFLKGLFRFVINYYEVFVIGLVVF